MDKIKQAIIGNGELNLTHLAKQAGIPRTTVQGWKENGVCGMSLIHFAKWTGARNMTGEEVLKIISQIRRAI